MDEFRAVVRAKLNEQDITDEEIKVLFRAGYRTLRALEAARPQTLSTVQGLSPGAQDLITANFSGQCTKVKKIIV